MTIHNIKIAEMLSILEDVASRGTKFIDISLKPNAEGRDIIIIHASVPTDAPLKIQTEI